MAQFAAPSFSLGLDDDDGDDPPAPSFSLGLDLDISDLPTEGEEDEPQPPPAAEPPGGVVPDSDEELDPLSLGPDSFPPAEDPPPSLKRLRRGPGLPPPPVSTPSAAPPAQERQRQPAASVNVDDEIEEFSSQEERRNGDHCSSLPRHATCTSSKFSLRGHGFLVSQPAKKLEESKVFPAFNASTSTNLDASSEKLFPKLTISPLRKFCLVDSDSDEPSSSKQRYGYNKDVDASQSIRQHVSSESASRSERKAAFQQNKVQTESLWKDFSIKESTNLATPILDEYCEEYFRSVKDDKADRCKTETISSSYRVVDLDDFDGYDQRMSITTKAANDQNLPNFQPPAYKYFYHGDARIRALVRERFRYFAPICADNNGGIQQTIDNIDYMSQFGSKQTSNGSSKKRGKRPMTAKANASPHATEGWVNPKTSASIPKNAGKRRVRADNEQMGHWFTGEDGRKVYVTTNGQELTGRMAYRHYRTENGGFRKSRKKAASKKAASKKATGKNAASKKAAGKNAATKKRKR